MTPERWQRIEEIYHSALEVEEGGRKAFLEEACAGDEVLRHEVESLLRSEPSAERFIEEPALKVAGKTFELEEPQSLVGHQVGSYQVLSLLGSGGMGEVYKARDIRLKRFVAIKVLPADQMSDPERKRRFIQEARAASALNHPNIITIHDIGREQDTDFIVMEYVSGKTLDQRIPRKGMKLNEALKIAIQAADALARAHSAGIIHRDLKPTNVMVTDEGQVKVLDFGLAKLTEVESDEGGTRTTQLETEEGMIVGTVSYMSPEQAEGKRVDARSDIFSFGTVFYEMVTGQRAFMGESNLAMLTAILHEEPKPVGQIVTGIPRDLEKIINRCLRKDRERRWQTMADLRVALQELKEESDSGKLAVASAAQKGHRRSFTWAAVLLVGLAVGGIALWLAHSSRNASDSLMNAVPFTSYPGDETDPSFSPDGNQVVFSWNGEGQDNFDIYVKLIGTGPPFRLTKHPSREFSPAWSPDGRSIAFLRELSKNKSAVLLIPPLGGPERKLTEIPASLELEGPYLAWSPDGKWLTSVDESSPESHGLSLISVESGERRRLTAPLSQTSRDGGLALSPDGHSLAFIRTVAFGVSDLYLLRLSDSLQPIGEPKRLTFDSRDTTSPAWTPDGREIVFASGQFHNRSLRRMAASGSGKPQQWATVGEDSYYPAISRQGRRFVYKRRVGDTNIWRVELSAHGKASPPLNFIHSTRGDTNPQFSPDGKRIAFVSDRSGNIEIWVCDSDGSNPVQLTSFGGPLAVDPRWSPDGERIAFDSSPEGQWEIYLISANGGRPQRLTSHPSADLNPSWSRDGRWIYFDSNRSGETQLWKMPANGGEPVQVTRRGGTNGFESVEGKVVYYEKDNGLWKLPVEGGDETRVLESLNAFGNFALVKEGIYFIPRANSAASFSIQFFNFATGKTEHIARLEKPADIGLTVSPDRRWILYSQIDHVDSDLMLVENFR